MTNCGGCHFASIQPVTGQWKFTQTSQASNILSSDSQMDMISTEPSLDYHLTSTWLPLDFHLNATWLPLDYHLTTTWLPLRYHLTTTWLPLDDYLTTTWLPLDYHLTSTWHPLVFHLDTPIIVFFEWDYIGSILATQIRLWLFEHGNCLYIEAIAMFEQKRVWPSGVQAIFKW